MKHLNVPLEDDDFERLVAVKGNRSWDTAILEEFGVADDE